MTGLSMQSFLGSAAAAQVSPQANPSDEQRGAILSHLKNANLQTTSTVASTNGDTNPYGVAFVPLNYHGGGNLSVGDILVSNFNDTTTQATGSTIVKISPNGTQSVFFQGSQQLGLTTALGILPQGFVLVGSAPATTDSSGTPTLSQGSLLILDSTGKQVGQITDPSLQGPWDLTIANVDAHHAQVFVSNVLNGTVTRLNLFIPSNGGVPQVQSATVIASGYATGTDPNALVVGPTGLAYDARTGTLYVASTKDNAIYSIADANDTNTDNGKGHVVVSGGPYLHGPLGLILAPNGNLIVSNGDAENQDPNHLNELTEFTRQGKFVAQLQVDNSTTPGAAFGLAAQVRNDQLHFAAVDDNTNALKVWTLPA